jgi:hypothetical protein
MFFNSCRAENDPSRVLPAIAKSSARLLGSEEPRSWQLTAGTSYFRQVNRGSARGFQDKIYRSLKFKHKRPCRESITVAESALPAGEK